jgi:XTP/dITP diphosphohydrolase
MDVEAIIEAIKKRPADFRKTEAFMVLLHIMDDLRDKCPWDKKQTNLTLRNLTIEEMYELADAIIENNPEDIKEEIGDIMLHMVFYSKIADENQEFDIADALISISQKLVKRHPHIYGDFEVNNESDVKKNWEQLKLQEGKNSVLQGVPKGLPAIVKSFRMQEKVAQVGFEWDRIDQVWEKVKEELGELEVAVGEKNNEHIEHEFGDVLFALVNYARFLKIDPETALEKVNKRFKYRFEFIEDNAPKPLTEMTLDEMDQLWNQAKMTEKS